MRKIAIILASGNGTRFGSENIPKQFVKVSGKTILEHSIDACDCGVFDEIVVAANRNRVEAVRRLVSGGSYAAPVKVIAGGDSRQASCERCVSEIKDEDAYVVVHNAAQPLVKKDTLLLLLGELAMHGASTAAIPCTETVVKINSDGFIEHVPERSLLMNQIGPEAFRLSILRKLFSYDREDVGSTSIAGSIVKAGICRVSVVQGDPGNRKVTYAPDLAYVEARLKERRDENGR